MTIKLLECILKVVDLSDDREMVVWVALVTAFYLILRKSNMVPLSRVHDTMHNIAQQDVRYNKGIMVITIRLSETNQFREKISEKPMMVNNHNLTCPVRWIMYMVNRIPAKPNHNLSSYRHPKMQQIMPITYHDLMVNLRKWLGKIGVKNSKRYLSHSFRWGGMMKMFNANLSDTTVMKMGG